ncbi:MAG: sigma-70 family RNA polymerase sigma factor [Candidatus Acidiferrales bacterium]
MNMPQRVPTVKQAIVSDEDLLFSSRDGSQEAFAELMDRYKSLVYRVANNILRDHGEAEDIVQYVFFEIYRHSAKFDAGRGTFRTWLLQYAYSRSKERIKYLSRRSFYQTAEVAEIESRVFVANSPTSEFEDRDCVRCALNELNERQRRVILLSHFEGHSLREIAEQSGEAYSAVRHHFYRGLKKMRMMLAGEA